MDRITCSCMSNEDLQRSIADCRWVTGSLKRKGFFVRSYFWSAEEALKLLRRELRVRINAERSDLKYSDYKNAGAINWPNLKG